MVFATVTCQVPNSVITSGGGFSAQDARPSWQNSAVLSYFSTAANAGESPVSGYSTNGRGYPDVSILGNNYAVVLNGSTYALSGTSASSPVFAGKDILDSPTKICCLVIIRP